jgi:hypothetical protein
MNKLFYTLFISIFTTSICSAQYTSPDNIKSDSLSKLKQQGKLTGKEWFYNSTGGTKSLILSNSARINNTNQVTSTTCNCWITRDTSFHPAPIDASGGAGGPGVAPLYQNDDWSTAGITLPFKFCFYGDTTAGSSTNQLFINNNGNVSFGSANPVFSAVPFPTNPNVMIAPFWADVATVLSTNTSITGYNTSGGVVYYKLTSTYLIVQWDSVGVYNHPGQINSFQLIITNGTDPILPPGSNISFCYGEMQWACGDASGGTNGFGYSTGGFPATVGLNKGDGVNSTQISLFDTTGTRYTNPSGSPVSGIGWLSGQSFYFNSCGTGNSIPPVATSGGPPSVCVGDTLNICAVGDILQHTVNFIPPSTAQTVSITASASDLDSNFSVTSYTSGASASLTFQVNSTGLSAGFYTVTVTATNSSSLSTTINYIIHILGGSGGCSTTGIKQVTGNNNQVSVYPNPNNGSFVIELQNTLYNAYCTLYDVNGKMVLTQAINGKTTIDASSLSEGVYQLSIQNSDVRITKKLVILK